MSTALALAAEVRSGQRLARQVVDDALSAVASGDGDLNAFLTVLADEARAGADAVDAAVAAGRDPGPLAGVPVALKDNLCTRGVNTTCGSKILDGWLPPYDATVVEALRNAGAITLGKTNMDEFAMGSSTENSAFGPTRNPRDTRRVPGGSSGGSAAAVAAGFTPLGLGSDTGGSIRQPAALCGVVGMKPTYGRVSRYGLVAFASSLDQIGPFATTVEDAALLFDVLAGHDPLDSTSLPSLPEPTLATVHDGAEGIRVGLCRDLVDGCAPDVVARVRQAADALADAGAKVEEISVPEFGYGLSAYYLIAPAEASSNLARYDGVRYGLRVDGEDVATMNTATRTAGFGAEVKRRIMLGTYALSAGLLRRLLRASPAGPHARDAGVRSRLRVVRRSPRRHRADDRVRHRGQGGRPHGDVHERCLHHPFQPFGAPRCLGALRHRGRRSAGRRAGAGAGAPGGLAVPRGPGGRVARTERAGIVSADWELVVGLEVHTELATATKLFCGCRNAFGDEPNVNVCPTCLGLPGSLPVLNEQAVELAMRIGAALHCEIRPSEFARKNYFYPDQAKDYQISQYDLPLNVGGWLELPDGFRVGVTRAHMEEDTGKLTHVGASGRINAALHALVDYNRSGVPLVEIVSEPDIRTVAQARAYVSELRGILMATGASDGRMEEGSMRVDANVSVRPVGTDAFGTRCEIKNLNSLRSLGRAIEYEAARQIALLESGGSVTQETRHWDESAGRTDSMRSKEEANDYRYFPEPDLVPLAPDEAWQARVRAGLGSMPADRRAVLASALGGSPTDAETDQIHAVVDLGLDALVTAAADAGAPAALALARAANEVAAQSEAGLQLDPNSFASVLAMESGGQLSATQSKAVLARSSSGAGETRPPWPRRWASRHWVRHPGRGARRGDRCASPTSGRASPRATTS